MTNEQILKKAIEKAVKNGWSKDMEIEYVDENEVYFLDTSKETIKKLGKEYCPFPFCCGELKHYMDIIFSHDFAKAFWGKGEYVEHNGGVKRNRGWTYHLQIIVLEKDPIKYLEKFL